MTTKAGTRRLSLPTALAAPMVLGAGVITWQGLSGANSSAAGGESSLLPVTLPSGEPAAARPASRAGSLPGGLPTRIVAASVGIDASIAEVGVIVEEGRPVWETAWRSVGHHIDSARPGQPGNMVLTGHVSVASPSHVASFKKLDQLKAGDIVEVYSGDQVFRYAITRVAVVPPSETRILRSDHASRLTLITCTRDLKQRLIVQGTLV